MSINTFAIKQNLKIHKNCFLTARFIPVSSHYVLCTDILNPTSCFIAWIGLGLIPGRSERVFMYVLVHGLCSDGLEINLTVKAVMQSKYSS